MDDSNELVRIGVDRAISAGGLGVIADDLLEVERVFLIWAEDPGQSVAEIAKRSGSRVGTIRRLLATGEFQRRYEQEMSGLREVAEPYMRARARELVDITIRRLGGIVEAGEDRDAIAASKVLIGLISGPEASTPTTQINVDARTLQIAQAGLHNTEDVKRVLTSAIAGNIDVVEQERSRRS